MERQRIRISDIAAELGMSTATVSNVIHGKTKKISSETVRLVQQKLEECEYLPRQAQVLLAQNESHIVGVVVHKHPKYAGHVLEDGFVAAALNALSGELDGSGYFMMVKVEDDWNAIARFASIWNMDGLVLIGFCEQDYQKLRGAMHIPFVVYDGYFSEARRICNVIVNSYGGGMLAGEYLRRMGHKKLLCISDNYICMDRERIDGCREAFGGTADTLLVPLDREERRSFYERQLPFIRRHTAVFAVSDVYAAEFISFLQMKGILVPRQISVIGFDDIPQAESLYPSLTTIRQDSRERARLAVSALLELRRGEDVPATIRLSVSLVERESVGRI